MNPSYVIRDPIHGLVPLDELERAVIDQSAFQRLRRIRQLAWTDMVYPAAMHTRFEHSLGVMHVATRLFDALKDRCGDILRSEYKFDAGSLDRQRRIIRLAALLHDIGHGPFSHPAEDLLPVDPGSGRRFEHEDYSASIMVHCLRDVINGHPISRNNGITVDDVVGIFSAQSVSPGTLLWKNLVSGQMDADRMDYLLRDAYHAGVSYGRYDLDRVVNTVCLCENAELGGHAIGVEQGGIHAVEGLLIARYMMFTQLYFHKTRAIYDYHLAECLKEVLKAGGGVFPAPATESISDYLGWDDWRVLGAIAKGEGGRHGEILRDRKHFRQVYETAEVADNREIEDANRQADALADLGCVQRKARQSWYKFQDDEILVLEQSGADGKRIVPLSVRSPVVRGLKTVNQRRLYVPMEHRQEAEGRVPGTTRRAT